MQEETNKSSTRICTEKKKYHSKQYTKKNIVIIFFSGDVLAIFKHVHLLMSRPIQDRYQCEAFWKRFSIFKNIVCASVLHQHFKQVLQDAGMHNIYLAREGKIELRTV